MIKNIFWSMRTISLRKETNQVSKSTKNIKRKGVPKMSKKIELGDKKLIA